MKVRPAHTHGAQSAFQRCWPQHALTAAAREERQACARPHGRLGVQRAFALVLVALLLALSTVALQPARPALAAASADEQSNQIDQQQVPDSSFLYDASISDLVNDDSSKQGATVQVTGEVVGDSVDAEADPGKHWITLDSLPGEDEGSISVLVDDDSLDLIDTYGEYGAMGTTLRVRGTFYMVCPTHEGIMDIHADNVEKVEDGYKTPDRLSMGDFVPGAIACGVAVGLMLLYYFLRERQR